MNLVQMQHNAPRAVSTLKAMANERRLQILCLLYEREYAVGELCGCLDLSQSALSQHLAWLRKEQIVITRKEAQTVFYSLASEEVKQIMNLLHTLYCE
ncbi:MULTISPECIES: helix-turn-helix transcriptional regulator [unclassified Vibrio]|uniref:Metalloregulator ArsR/SmtB family transcription factor n=1 Tax=Vibrio sp. HB236076 TaxID=3232307 RepID=A0AB39HI32_9VIBR|nr:metalloregulator ArsR/SmtB family transcription factor [Vibrio sp. HB161653]MDP5254604.1 metalloregulator ArsR/SmtB family transcription factor [Vibrio sp. HB161653]